jgi:hypothetical protein
MKTKTLLTLVVVLALVGFAASQMRGGMGGGSASTSGMGRGPSSMDGMHGGPQDGMGGPGMGGTMSPMQRRQLMHTTSMQDHKYQACTQAMNKVQGDLSQMQMGRGANSVSGDSGDSQQASDDSTDGLSSDLQDLSQSDDDFSASLNSDQEAVLAAKMKDLEKKTKEMQALAQQLKSELARPDADAKLLKAQMKKLKKLSNEIAKHQHEIAATLGIAA